MKMGASCAKTVYHARDDVEKSYYFCYACGQIKRCIEMPLKYAEKF